MPDLSIKLLTLLSLVLIFGAHAQRSDVLVQSDSATVEIPEIESFQSVSTFDPDLAVLYSAVIPGLGQMYNKQYWKLPFVYGGFIIFGHLIKYNNDLFQAFRNAYIAEIDGDDSTVNPFPRFSTSSLQLNAEQFRRNRDYMIIFGIVFYLIQVADAHIAAHLSEFDLNDDLSLEFKPVFYQNSQYTTQNIGLSLVLHLNK